MLTSPTPLAGRQARDEEDVQNVPRHPLPPTRARSDASHPPKPAPDTPASPSVRVRSVPETGTGEGLGFGV